MRDQELPLLGFSQAPNFPASSLPRIHEGDVETPNLAGGESYEWAAIANLDVFFSRVYRYWHDKGPANIIVSGLLNILALAFTIGFSGLLLLFVNWPALHSECIVKDTCDIMSVAIFTHPLKHHTTFVNLLVLAYCAIFGMYLVWTVVHYVTDVRDVIELSHFVKNKLGISERQVTMMTWAEVVHRIVLVQRTTRLCITRDLNEHDIVSRIMRKDNYLIGMLNRGLLKLHVPIRGLRRRSMLTKTLEWNLRWCVLDNMFDERFEIRPAFLAHPDALRRRLRCMAAANLLLAPFLLAFIILFFFMKNAERFYHHPGSLGSRRWSSLAKWRTREFNELPHYINHRLAASHEAATKYVAQFPSHTVTHLARFIAFVTGSFAALLLFVTMLDETLLERPLLGRHIVWWLATLSVLLTASRAFISEHPVAYDPEGAMLEVAALTHYLPRHWRGRAHSGEVQSQFESLFQLKVLQFLEETASIVLTPFVLYFTLPDCVDDIIQFVRDFTVTVEGVGDVCSLATFDLQRHGNPKYGAPTAAHSRGKEVRSRQGKLEKSFLTFVATYPTWEPHAAGKQMLSTLGRHQATHHGSSAAGGSHWAGSGPSTSLLGGGGGQRGAFHEASGRSHHQSYGGGDAGAGSPSTSYLQVGHRAVRFGRDLEHGAGRQYCPSSVPPPGGGQQQQYQPSHYQQQQQQHVPQSSLRGHAGLSSVADEDEGASVNGTSRVPHPSCLLRTPCDVSSRKAMMHYHHDVDEPPQLLPAQQRQLQQHPHVDHGPGFDDATTCEAPAAAFWHDTPFCEDSSSGEGGGGGGVSGDGLLCLDYRDGMTDIHLGVGPSHASDNPSPSHHGQHQQHHQQQQQQQQQHSCLRSGSEESGMHLSSSSQQQQQQQQTNGGNLGSRESLSWASTSRADNDGGQDAPHLGAGRSAGGGCDGDPLAPLPRLRPSSSQLDDPLAERDGRQQHEGPCGAAQGQGQVQGLRQLSGSDSSASHGATGADALGPSDGISRGVNDSVRDTRLRHNASGGAAPSGRRAGGVSDYDAYAGDSGLMAAFVGQDDGGGGDGVDGLLLTGEGDSSLRASVFGLDAGGGSEVLPTNEEVVLVNRIVIGHSLLQSFYEGQDLTVQHRMQNQMHTRMSVMQPRDAGRRY